MPCVSAAEKHHQSASPSALPSLPRSARASNWARAPPLGFLARNIDTSGGGETDLWIPIQKKRRKRKREGPPACPLLPPESRGGGGGGGDCSTRPPGRHVDLRVPLPTLLRGKRPPLPPSPLSLPASLHSRSAERLSACSFPSRARWEPGKASVSNRLSVLSSSGYYLAPAMASAV